MNDSCRPLTDGYAVALQDYLREPEEPGLMSAHELGRQALIGRMGLLDIASIHSRALSTALMEPLADDQRARLLNATETFFVEALSPFEMALRGFWEANDTLQRLNEVLEGQVKRIGAALHDESGQLLASVHLALADIASTLPFERAEEIRAVRRLLDEIEQRLRRLSHELRPPILNDLGLIPALEFLADCMSKRWGIPLTVQASLDRALPAMVETTLYRITQEALTNVAKHAKATRAHVRLEQADRRIVCSVRDDGIGFDLAARARRDAAPGLGLLEIRERVVALGGVFHLGSNGSSGAEITVEIPLER
jgi:signal transduction histidine kinase